MMDMMDEQAISKTSMAISNIYITSHGDPCFPIMDIFVPQSSDYPKNCTLVDGSSFWGVPRGAWGESKGHGHLFQAIALLILGVAVIVSVGVPNCRCG